MLAGVILLALTGWPLRGAGAVETIGMSDFTQRVESSRKFLAVFGGAHGAGIVHRVAAVMIILSGVYHLVYLTFLAKRRASADPGDDIIGSGRFRRDGGYAYFESFFNRRFSFGGRFDYAQQIFGPVRSADDAGTERQSEARGEQPHHHREHPGQLPERRRHHGALGQL